VPTNFDGVKQIVADEVIKGIIGAGGGVADREHAQAIFDRAKSPEQLTGAVTEIKKLLRGQLKGLEKQYKATTGRDDFEDRFLTDSARELDKGASSAGAGKVARPKSKAEYDALPSGTRVILPNGKEGVKP
jgi:hypothetical protein